MEMKLSGRPHLGLIARRAGTAATLAGMATAPVAYHDSLRARPPSLPGRRRVDGKGGCHRPTWLALTGAQMQAGARSLRDRP